MVIGGGAAGLMAAGQVALTGAECIVLEKMKRPGRKLRITGKGRCNLTNTAELREFIGHFGPNGRFLRQAFDRFSPSDLVTFFNDIGVLTVTERGGRVFPASDDARDVVDALIFWTRQSGAEIRTSQVVSELIIRNGRACGAKLKDNRTLTAEAVIIATGGKSYPATGSTGDGYRLAEKLGHKIIPPRPALVPIDTAGDIPSRLEGLSLQNVTARMIVNGKKKTEAFGEMIFTATGMSGPIILGLSRQIVDVLVEDQEVTVSIDLKPALDDEKLDARLLRDFEERARQELHNLLGGLLPRKLIPVCIDQTAISGHKTGNQITTAERKRLRLWLKDFRFEITGHRPFEEAIITAGGISTKEIDPRTMQSRLVEGLYFAGEVIDVDADTGGFNLQAAFSTGWLAGLSASTG